MAKRYVFGTYPTYQAALHKADELVSHNVPRGSITLVANDIILNPRHEDYNHIPTEEVTDNRNWFQKLFGMDEEQGDQTLEEIDFSKYEDSLENNDVLLVVDSEYEGIIADIPSGNAATAYTDRSGLEDSHTVLQPDYDSPKSDTIVAKYDLDSNEESDILQPDLNIEQKNEEVVSGAAVDEDGDSNSGSGIIRRKKVNNADELTNRTLSEDGLNDEHTIDTEIDSKDNRKGIK